MAEGQFAHFQLLSWNGREIESRRKRLGAGQEELARAVKAQFNAENIEKDASQVKAMSASGFVDSSSAPQPATHGGPAVESREKPAPVPAVVSDTPAATPDLATLSNDL